jgi:amino acid permease
VLLFSAIILFIFILTIQLLSKGTYANPDESYTDYYKVKLDVKLLTAISIFIVAYGF